LATQRNLFQNDGEEAEAFSIYANAELSS